MFRILSFIYRKLFNKTLILLDSEDCAYVVKGDCEQTLLMIHDDTNEFASYPQILLTAMAMRLQDEDFVQELLEYLDQKKQKLTQ